MRFVRKIKFLLFAVSFTLLIAPVATAQEIPSLTWERGKSLNVVLGGSIDNLEWDVFLEDGKMIQIAFTKSRANSADFYVYTISLPKETPLGQYQVVARSDTEPPTIVAGVQVIDRFAYNITEIPRDLIFILTCLILVLSMQTSLRTWVRREVDEVEVSRTLEVTMRAKSPFGEITHSFLMQRVRWKIRWLAKDYYPANLKNQNPYFLALAPLFVLVVSLYLGVEKSLYPLSSHISLLSFAILASIALLDRYSAKLTVLGLASGFMIFNETLNFPTLLGFAIFLTSFLLPQYIGDLTREFLTQDSKQSSPHLRLADAAGALGVGLSIFWVYLLSESLRLSDSTDASRVTPIATLLALLYLYRVGYSARSASDSLSKNQNSLNLLPIVGLASVIGILLIGAAVVLVWTSSLVIAVLSALILLGSLLTIHFVPKSPLKPKVIFLRNKWTQLASIVTASLVLFFAVSQAPLVIQDRSNLLMVSSGIPVLFVSALVMLKSAHGVNRRSSFGLSDNQKSSAADSPTSSGGRN